MPYATRPMGDYKTYGYSGDPGFLSSLWKGVKRVAGVVVKAAFPVPAAIYGAITAKPSRPTPTAFLPTPASFPGIGLGLQAPGAGARGPSMPGWVSPTTAGMTAVPGQMGTCPSGYHFAKDGSGRLVRNRRMNVANPRALRRSMRRVQGFEKLAKRTIQFTRRVRMKKRKTS